MINRETLARDIAYVLAFRPEVTAFSLFARRDGKEARLISPTRITPSTSTPEEMAANVAQATDTYARLSFHGNVGPLQNPVIVAAFFKFSVKLYDLGEVIGEIPVSVVYRRPPLPRAIASTVKSKKPPLEA